MQLTTRKIVYLIFVIVLLGFGIFFYLTLDVHLSWKNYLVYFTVRMKGVEDLQYSANTPSVVVDEMTKRCSRLGGKMIGSGCGIGGCTGSCVLPYQQGGKVCTSSKDCGDGKCLLFTNNGSMIFLSQYRGVYLTSSKWGGDPDPLENTALYECAVKSDENGKYLVKCDDVSLIRAKCQKYAFENCQEATEFFGKMADNSLKIGQAGGGCIL